MSSVYLKTLFSLCKSRVHQRDLGQETHLTSFFGRYRVVFAGIFWARIAGCFPPYRARKASGVEIPEKWGKITKFPSPVRPPKMGKIGPKKGKNYSENTKFVIFR